jgi:hypothetical protein
MPQTLAQLNAATALAVAKTIRQSAIDAAFVAALAADNPDGYSFTFSGTTYVMPVTLEHQAIATLALLDAQATGATVSIPHVAGVLDVADNAAGVAILGGYAGRFQAHTKTHYLRSLSINAATTEAAVNAVSW